MYLPAIQYYRCALALFLTVIGISAGQAEQPTAEPLPVPLTRPEMKQYLEDLKLRKPRIPLPELTAGDRERLGERATSYETRLRYHYLPSTEGSSPAAGSSGFASFGFSREPDPNMSLDYAFKTQLFWIVSRTNNCQY